METIPFVHTGLHILIWYLGGVDFRTINIHQSPSRLAVDTYEVGVWHVPPLREKIIVNQWTIHSPLFQGFTPHGKDGSGKISRFEKGNNIIWSKAPSLGSALGFRGLQQWVTNGLHSPPVQGFLSCRGVDRRTATVVLQRSRPVIGAVHPVHPA